MGFFFFLVAIARVRRLESGLNTAPAGIGSSVVEFDHFVSGGPTVQF
jgi:hypothetical protein